MTGDERVQGGQRGAGGERTGPAPLEVERGFDLRGADAVIDSMAEPCGWDGTQEYLH